MAQTREQLLQAHAALPEAYQPAWGLPESAPAARRSCRDRFDVVLAAVAAFPGQRPLRVLDIGCAQGYFSLGLTAELQRRGCAIEVIGVDSLEANVRFCEELAAHHGLQARFVHDRFDTGFFERHALAGFDIVLALNVLHHVRQLHGAAVATSVLDAIRGHSRALLCEVAQPEEALQWVKDWHDSDDALLAEYSFRRRLESFHTHVSDVPRPLYVCSDTLAFVGGRWFNFDKLELRAHPDVPDRFAGQRKFFIGSDTIVKACRGDGEFGAFNRAEFDNEIEILSAMSEDSRFPRVLGHDDDGDFIWIARELLPGRRLSDLVRLGEPLEPLAIARALLGELARLENHGLYHGDIRAWNVILHGSELRLIDFGSMTRSPHPLHRVALAGVILELTRSGLGPGQPWYELVHPVQNAPAAMRPLLRYLYGSPQASFSYAQALRLLAGAAPPSDAASVEVADEVLAACLQAQSQGFAGMSAYVEETRMALSIAENHAKDLSATLRRQTAEAEAERATARAALEDSSRYVDSLQQELAKVRADAGAELDSLKQELSRTHESAARDHMAARSALAKAAQYAESLRHEVEKVGADARSEIELLRQELAHARESAAAGDAAQKPRTDVELLQREWERQGATSMPDIEALKQELSREREAAMSNLAAAQAELADAAARASSAERKHLESRVEHARLIEQLEAAERNLQRMRRRFRAFKPLWPREPERGEGTN